MSPTVRNGRGERETYVVDLVGSPASAVERRQAADHEREGFAPGRVSPGLSSATPRHLTESSLARRAVVNRQNADQLHASRMRGAARHLEVVSARAEPRRSIAVLPSPVTPEEEPAMAIEPPRADPEPIHLIISQVDALNAVQAALSEAIEIQSALDAARRAERDLAAAQKEAYEVLRAACRRAGLAEPLDVFATVPPARERVLVDEPALEEERQVALEDAAVAAALRDDRLGDEPAGEPGKTAAETRRAAAAGGGPGPKLTQRDRILGAIVEQRGQVKAIASALGVDRAVVNAQLHQLGRQHRLTIAMLDVLPASFAKYSTAGD